MTRKDIEQGLRRVCGGGDWINRTQLAQYMNCSKDSPKLKRVIRGTMRLGSTISIIDLSVNIYDTIRPA